MGSTQLVRVPEIVMQYIENKIIKILKNKLKFWRRCVDDVFFVSEPEALNEILSIGNSICTSMQFTIEYEKNCLPFFNILIEREDNFDNQKTTTPVYRKDTFFRQYLNFLFHAHFPIK